MATTGERSVNKLQPRPRTGGYREKQKKRAVALTAGGCDGIGGSNGRGENNVLDS